MNLEEFNRVEILLIDKKSGSVSKIELSLIKAYKRYNNNN